jgi:hypothetical protein
MRRSADGWKIIDTGSAADIMRTDYASAKAEGISPLPYMELFVRSAIGEKHGFAREAMRGAIMSHLIMIDAAIELFVAIEKRYPDFLGKGWDELITSGYLKGPPPNPVNGATRIIAGSTGHPDAGWHWDAESKQFGACFFNEKTQELTLEEP